MIEAENSEAGVATKVKYRPKGRAPKGSGILPMARSKMPEYSNWTMMRHRCYNPKRKDYRWYGALGITICDRWLHGENGLDGFECFFLDMGFRPEGEGTIDRVDGKGNYCKENCIWSHIAPQQTHKSSTAYYEFRGERLCRAVIARKYGIPYSAFRERVVNLGWSVEQALLTPSVPIKKIGPIEYEGRFQTIKQWAEEVGLKYATLLTRLKKGWTMKDSLYTPLGEKP